MATPVIMPRQGQSVESCLIAKWHKKVGDAVKAGDLLFSYETDKAAFDEEARVDGILLDIFFEEGDDVPVLTNVCAIGNAGENVSEYNPSVQGKPGNEAMVQSAKAEADIKTAEPQTVERQPDSGNNEIRISPRAKHLAEKIGVDIRYATPSGPHGRVIERDVEKLAETGPLLTPAASEEYSRYAPGYVAAGTGIGGRITVGDLRNAAVNNVGTTAQEKTDAVEHPNVYEEVKLTNIRKVIAKAMHNSLSTTAQLTLNASFDATDILAFRKKLKENREKLGLQNITLNDIILYAVSRTILKHRELNAHFLDEKMLLFKDVHLGTAVDTERGLMVPTIFNANRKSLDELAAEAKKLAEECQKGTINPDYLKGASFTVTNLGALDIESFTPVINPPQTGILGVCNINQRVREKDGQYVYYPAMSLSLTFDHRALDGAPAARFLKDLKISLENFSILLAK